MSLVGTILKIIGVGSLAVIMLFISAVIGAIMGAFAGWVVGFTVLGTWILQFLSSAGIHTNMVDFGCFCGFFGGFVKATLSND